MLTVVLLSIFSSSADEMALVAGRGTLLFSDSFERDEPDAEKESIGEGWSSNSAWRAKGRKQVDLDAGVMKVRRLPEADHGVAIFHDTAFRDGAVELRFRLEPGDDLGLDFVDRELKSVHAGHLCMARVTLKNLRLIDHKTGGMDNRVRERRQSGPLTPELKQLLASKSRQFPLQLDAESWHTLLVVVEGDEMRVTVDGRAAGSFRSSGMAHPTKRLITLAVNRSAWVDDVKIWRLR
jgi:hypothetical protein